MRREDFKKSHLRHRRRDCSVLISKEAKEPEGDLESLKVNFAAFGGQISRNPKLESSRETSQRDMTAPKSNPTQ